MFVQATKHHDSNIMIKKLLSTCYVARCITVKNRHYANVPVTVNKNFHTWYACL